MKTIAIDISPIIYGTGVSVYTRELVKNILKVDKKNRYILFGYSLRRKNELENFYNQVKNSYTKSKFFLFPPTFVYFLWNKLHIIDVQRLIGKVDVIHTSDWTEPPAKNTHKVTTVHDLTPILYPKYTHPRIIDAHRSKLTWVKKETDMIIVPSEQTKKDLINIGFRETKIVVIPEAVSDDIKFIEPKEARRVLKKYNLPEKFALMVGTSPRKNIRKTYKALQKASKKVGFSTLVVVGERPDEIKYKNSIFLGKVNNMDLSALYSVAEVFLYTSIYEGFGLPVLEAFKCECPVVASNVGSVKEISLNSALLVNPSSINNVAKGIEMVLRNKIKYKKAGLSREKNFSWRETAKKTLKLYNYFG